MNICSVSSVRTRTTADEHYDYANTTKANEEFSSAYSYDANGNMRNLRRTANGQILDNLTYSYHETKKNQLLQVADAIGNTMAVYDRKTEIFDTQNIHTTNNNTAIFRPLEYPIYGSSRLGNYMPQAENRTTAGYTLQSDGNLLYSTPLVIVKNTNDYLNSRNYELNDHLGNVSATVSDYKINTQSQQLSAHVYYPFGMELPSADRCVGKYRYGFNGKEKDLEGLGGGGSTYDYGFRIYNQQIARFLSVDPLTKSYPMLTPYQFASNSPISGVDLDGLEYFYAANGALLGKMGTSTEVMLVDNKDVATTQYTLTKINGIESKMNYVEKDNGLNIVELNIYKKQVESVMSTSNPVGLTNEELNTRAFMSLIKEMENHGHGELQYNDWNGGKKFKGSKHPGLNKWTDRKGKEHVSSAAGAFQIMKYVWNASEGWEPRIKKMYNLTDFSNGEHQELFVYGLLKYKRNLLPEIEKGNIKQVLQSNEMQKEWTSTPGASQAGISLETGLQIFKQKLSDELNSNT